MISVKKVVFNKKKPENSNYIIQVSNDSYLAEIKKIKYLAYQKPKWEHLKKTQLFQCKRCQRFGHASSNCQLPFQCVKCSESHAPGECPLKETDNKEHLKCANCGMMGHPATYRGCFFSKSSLDFIKESAAKKHQQIHQRTNQIKSRLTNPAFSYANATDELDTIFDKLNLHHENNFYIIADDFNARHQRLGDKNSERRGTFLLEWIDSNADDYRAKIHCAEMATFLPGNTFLDYCILDSRLSINNLNNDKIKTLGYDSDHRALLIHLNLNRLTQISLSEPPPPRLVYKATDWEQFQKSLKESYSVNVANDRNLTREEIDGYLEDINTGGVDSAYF